MKFAKSVRLTSAVYPEKNVLNHVFPFYHRETGVLSFFGRITKIDDNSDWVVTPLKFAKIDNNVYNISDEASGNDYTVTTHSGRRLFIDEPYEIDKSFDVEHMPLKIKKLFVTRLFIAEFYMPVKDMKSAYIPSKIKIDSFM